jgi:hypothetical protein
VLYLEGKSLRDLVLIERKEILSVSYWRSGAYPAGKGLPSCAG